MSTKIYNGYKINSNNLQEIFDLSIKIRDDLRESTQKFLDNCAINIIYEILDQIYINDKYEIGFNVNETKIEDVKVYDIAYKFCNAQFKQGCSFYQTFQSYRDLNSSISILPIGKEYSLLLEFIPNELNFKLKDYPLIEEYSYYDNSDKPDDISEEEWEIRKLDWDVLGYEPPSCNGFSIEAYGAYNYYRPNLYKILDKFEVTEEFNQWRIKQLSFNLVAKEIDFIEKSRKIKVTTGKFIELRKEAEEIVNKTNKYKEEKGRILKYVESTIYKTEEIKDLRFDILENGNIIKK